MERIYIVFISKSASTSTQLLNTASKDGIGKKKKKKKKHIQNVCSTVYMINQRSKISPAILPSTYTNTSEDCRFISFLHASSFNPIIQESRKYAEYLHSSLMCKIGLHYFNSIYLNDKILKYKLLFA